MSLWFEVTMVVLGLIGLLILGGISAHLNDVRYKLGNVVASEKLLARVLNELADIATKVESIDRRVERIDNFQGKQTDPDYEPL